MTEPPSHPSRLLRFVAGCARWGFGVMVALWLLLAATWGGLHGWIVPRIGDYRPQLEAQAERALGIPVRIGAITARSEGIFPSVELSQVALLDAQGREALLLPRVVLALSPRSLLRLGFEQIYLQGPALDMRRAADGAITVAGLALRESPQGDSEAADWLFGQAEVVIADGTLRWTDELRGAEPLALTQVDLVLRNGGWRHAMRLDATPPADWGERFTLRGRFRQPLLTTHGGNWRRWNGQLYADFARVDVSRLDQYLDLDALEVRQGHGALRAWVDVQRGEAVGATVDLALGELNATLGRNLQPLVLRAVTGRVGGRLLEGGFEFSSDHLQFQADDGLRWPDGKLLLRYMGADQPGREQGELQADRLDLAALAQIARRLPLDAAVHQALQTYAPQGLVQPLQVSWQGPLDGLRQYQLRGKVTALALGAQDATPAVAGLSGANLELDLTHQGGHAELGMADGRLLLPGVFEDPIVPVHQLSATVRWQVAGQRISVQTSDLRFANADAAGEARLAWRTADAADGKASARFPGVLDMSGSLSRADGTRVHRYLPLAIPAETRHYVRDAVLAGSASQVQFRVKGDLHDFPYGHAPRLGEFHIAARVKDVHYGYVPPSLIEPGHLPWPALVGLSGELVFDRASMLVRNAQGGFAGRPAVRIQKVGAKIADLEHSVVEVDGQVRGPLHDMLGLVSGSQIAQLTEGALERATATGTAELQLGLSLPLSKMAQSRVRGSVTLAGNEVRFVPEAPTVSGARGVVQFSETGFALAGVQGRALGGDVRLEGGMGSPAGSVLSVRARGTATAEGLRAAPQLGLVAQLAQHASGSAAYAVTIGVRRGEPEILVTTDLVGMALAAPAPLGKSAQTPLAVRVENRLTPEAAASNAAPLQDQLMVNLGDVARLAYVRALDGAHARVLRGAIAVGEPTTAAPSMPEQGVHANAALPALDVDAWRTLLDAPASTASGPLADAASVPDYLPTRLALRAGLLTVQGRTLHDLVAGATRTGATWRANLSARELDGYLEYQTGGSAASDGQPQQDRLHARLARLAIPQAAETQVNALLDAQQPARLPALDITVQDFELHGRRLGRIDIEARNGVTSDGQREWRLSRFNITAPEATLTSRGDWTLLAGSGAAAQRRTRMHFELDVRDSGQLLSRLGMDGVLRRGKGGMTGEVSWLGSPLSPDYRSMAGLVHVNMEAGQFLKADPGLAKLLGVLSLQSLPRRFALDFRDVFSEGFAFDFVRGDVRINQGVATTNNLQMKGVSAAVLMEGSADIEHETQDLHVVVVPEINAMTASLVATAINPVVGLGSFLAQMFLRGPLIQAATQEFRIDGTWTEPRVERIQGRKSQSASDDAHAVPATTPGGKP